MISSALLGISQEESDSHFAKMYLPIVTEMNKRVWNPFRDYAFFLPSWWRYRATLKALDSYVSDIILSIWREGGHSSRTSEMMKKVMDGATMGKPGSSNISSSDLRQMISEVKTFILAGHETSASMINYTMVEAIRRKDILQRILGELDNASPLSRLLFKRKKYISHCSYLTHHYFLFPLVLNFNLTSEEAEEVWGGWKEGEPLPDVSRLVFTEACLKETLRRYSTVPTIVKVAACDTVLGCHAIPKGTGIVILSQGVHMRPDLWPEPEKYDPNRFLGPGKIEPYTFLAFSEGPRVCLGQHFSLTESKIVVSLLFRKFRFEFNMDKELAFKRDPRVVPVTPKYGTHLMVYNR